MPLLGKIVVIKRNGTDGTEFPLTASCLFGRKLDCDIRIQLPQVSKEHCRIDFNENKELILTNLSSVNPTRINGEILQQSERLKDGDLITIIDRSFRFEYPPPPTPKRKRLSVSEKGDSVKVLQDQQVKTTPGPTDKKKSEHSSDTYLKDGSNLPTPVNQCKEAAGGDSEKPVKANTDSSLSPFSELYHMVKRDLVTKSPWKSRRVTDLSNETDAPTTPKSSTKKKQRRSSSVTAVDVGDVVAANKSENAPDEPQQQQTATPRMQDIADQKNRRSSGPLATLPPKSAPQATPEKFSAEEVARQILTEKTVPKSPKSPRKSAASRPQSPAVTPKKPTPQTPAEPSTETPAASAGQLERTPRTSPRTSAGKRFQVQEVLQEVVATPALEDKASKKQASGRKHKANDLPVPAPKRKRVSFGGQLSPELFDKHLPPNSPLRRGATPGRRSLGFTHKPQSLLRRASTIGLTGFRLDEEVQESPAKSPKRASSPAKGARDATSPAKTPSPARKSPNAKSATPSPKKKNTPSPATPKTPKSATPSPKNKNSPATPKTPKSARRVSSREVLAQTPTVTGRFSISRISTPSPVSDPEKDGKADSACSVETTQECETPKIPLIRRRSSSLKASVRKTPKSAMKSALEVMRSRRSGASRANLKVVSSWADIVRFGQTKPQAESGVKKTGTKQMAAKPTAKPDKMAKPKTPARRLKDISSTGHADSPATIVIGKAFTRSMQPVTGAAPKVVPNMMLFRKDMKMDEDLTGVADIFKTPAANKHKSFIETNRECPETPLGVAAVSEMSVMSTPEETGEMMVSPMSVASTAKLGYYNSDAVTRLLQDNQDVSLIDKDDPRLNDSDNLSAPDVVLALQMSSDEQKEEAEPVMKVQTPKQKAAAASECLTGVKRLLRTPKQKAEPVEDLRGRLLKTPREPKQPQEENLDGVKELLKTPKSSATPSEDLAESRKAKNSSVMKTPKDRANKEEDLTRVKELVQTPKLKGQPVNKEFGVKRLMKTPKQKNAPVEEDFTGIMHMMKTPKQKNVPVEEDFTGIMHMMKTPKQKNKPVEEDLTGIQEMMKTPKQTHNPVKELLTGTQQVMTTPKQKNVPVEEDLTGIMHMMKTPKQKNKPVEEDLTGIQEMMKTPKQTHTPVKELLTGTQQVMTTPKQKNVPVEEDLTGIQQMMKTPKQKNAPVEEDLTGIQQMMKTPKQKNAPVEEDLTGIQQMMKTPKEKGVPVESQFGIRNLMKTPRRRGDEVVEDFTGLAELVVEPASDICQLNQHEPTESVQTQDTLTSVDSEVLAVEGIESENKENICPEEDVEKEREAPAAVQNIPQDETIKETGTVQETQLCLEEEKTAAHKEDREVQDQSVELETVSEAQVSVADVALTSTSPEQEAKANVSSPVKTTQRVGRGKAAQKSRKCQDQTDSSENQVPKALASVRGRRAKLAVDPQESLPVPSPVRKSARGRVQKRQIEDQTDKAEASEESREKECPMEPKQVEQAASKSPAPATNGRKGRKAKTESESTPTVPPPLELAHVVEAAPALESELSSESAAPAKTNTRGRRGRQAKKTAEVVEASEKRAVAIEPTEPEPVVEENSSSENAEKVQNLTDVPVKASTRSKRGRATKNDTSKTAEESDSNCSGAPMPEEPQTPTTKPARGRRAKTAVVKDQLVEEEPKANPKPVVQESEHNPEVHVVKSGRGAKSRQAKSQVTEEAIVHADETSPAVAEAEEQVVKSTRGGKRTKQSKADTVSDVVHKDAEQSEPPPVRAVRGKRTAVVKEEPDVQVKRGRRGATSQAEAAPSPSVLNPRRGGRKAVVAVEPEGGKEDAAGAEVPNETEKMPEVETEETSAVQTSTGSDDIGSKVAVKRGRGKGAPQTKTASKEKVEEASADTEDTMKSKKSVNWNANLVSWKDIEEAPLVEAEQSNQQREIEEETSKKSAAPPPKGRKLKGAKKTEPPVPEKAEPDVRESAQPGRRGRSAASAASKVSDEAALTPKSGSKRKEREAVTDETQDANPLPKRKRGKTDCAEVQTQTAIVSKGRRAADKGVKEMASAEPEQSEPKKEEKAVRGRRKATQEGDTAAVPQDPVPEVTTRRTARAPKKAEVDVPSTPVRRTRRK